MEMIQVVYAIDDTLDAYCRACPNLNNITSKICETCPIGVELQSYGALLGGGEKIDKPHVRWSKKDNAKLIKLYGSGVPASEIAHKLKRTKQSVYKRLARLKKNGVIIDVRT